VISILSTSAFSSDKTAVIIDPICMMMPISAVPRSPSRIFWWPRPRISPIRRAFFLLIRGPMAGRPYLAFALCVCYAMLDEAISCSFPDRGASLYDVALDSSGALFSNFLTLAIAGTR